MRSSSSTRHAFLPPAAALACVLMLGGCSGNSTNSGSSAPGATSAPQAASVPQSVASSGANQHRHRRHHRKYQASGGASGAVAATGAAGAAGAVVASGAVAGTHAAATGGTWPCTDSQFVQDQQQFANGTLRGDREVDVCGTVTRVLASKVTRSGLHGYYYVQVAPGDTIEIVSDLGQMDAPAWPWVKTGDYSYVQGRYYYDSPLSQGIDWTHHGTSNSWPSAGYVVVNGTQYQ
jgi:hypothetical protein